MIEKNIIRMKNKSASLEKSQGAQGDSYVSPDF